MNSNEHSVYKQGYEHLYYIFPPLSLRSSSICLRLLPRLPLTYILPSFLRSVLDRV